MGRSFIYSIFFTVLGRGYCFKWNCSENGWLLNTEDVCKGMLLHSHTRKSILFTFSGPTDVKKGIKLICYSYFLLAIGFFVCGLEHFCIALPVIIISISL